MARRPRYEEAGALHHVFARGARRAAIVLDDHDRRTYFEHLAAAIQTYAWRCLAYCLMGNHVHLVVETREPNLSAGMWRAHGRYARAFNRRHGLRGHVFEDRYGSKRITNDAYLATLVPYLAHNPVQARLCRRPEDWRWGSHAAIATGLAPAWLDERRLLELVGGRRQYAALVARDLAVA